MQLAHDYRLEDQVILFLTRLCDSFSIVKIQVLKGKFSTNGISNDGIDGVQSVVETEVDLSTSKNASFS